MKQTFILTSLLSLTLMTGCVQHPDLASEQRPEHWGRLLQQEQNLYQISDFLYRSEQPLHQQSQTLHQLGIDTIISLRSRNKTAREFQDESFNIIHIPIHTWAIDREDVLVTMQAFKQAQQKKHRVLIHCYHGSDRTGTMVAMYRIFFENWSTDDAVKEMKYGGYGFHPIWVNIDRLFSTENITWIRQHLDESNGTNINKD
ncbi:dual specificity protein phosphatase family protein [Acinetobacter puyangensis]|uniref:phosphatase domain-containing protein n=1 Tax=Acinetobacter puyangensis TaxID=1096779 RepID=UPI003A4D639C